MADITRDTHDDDKNYTKVTFQRATPPLEFELNELQDNLHTQLVEHSHTLVGGMRATQEGAEGGMIRPGVKGAALTPYGSGANILLEAGEIFVEGYRIVFPSDIDLTAEGLTFEGTASADTYGFIYADIVVSEITSSTDSNIATAQLGETALREKVEVTFKQAEGGTSFDATWASITPLTPAGGDRLWKGHVARVFICRYFRESGNTVIGFTHLFTLRSAVGGELAWKYQNAVLTTHHPYYNFATPGWVDADGDGMVAWHAGEGKLIIGALNEDEATGSVAYQCGGVLVVPARADFYNFFQETSGVAHLNKGSGDTDGDAILQDWSSDGWTIGAGYALGYIPISASLGGGGSPAAVSNGIVSTKAGSAAHSHIGGSASVNPLPSALTSSGDDPVAVIVSKLQVDLVTEFEANAPNSFMICRRHGNDLLWSNGHVTRGRTDRPVLDDLGNEPTPWDAVISTHGNTHTAGPDAIERAINFLRDDSSPGALGTSNVIKLHVRNGVWAGSRQLHEFGLASEFSTQATNGAWDKDNNGIELHGEGPSLTRIITAASDNASTTILGNLNFRAQRVVLKGITFSQTFSDSRAPRYTVAIYANEVILENCHFQGGVVIASKDITVKDCTFEGLGNSSVSHAIAAASGDPYVGQHLHLSHRASGSGVMSRWTVENCHFTVREDRGTHASVVLASDPTQLHTLHNVHISRCMWSYSTGTSLVADQPAVHVAQPFGDIRVDHCRFSGANGVVKSGADTSVTAAPFNGDLSGSPAVFSGGGDKHVATAYVSVTGQRANNSSLTVDSNYFDVGSFIGAVDTGRFMAWGAMIVYPSFTSLGQATGTVANIRFENNTLKMSTSGSAGATWNGTQTNPALWGFYLAASTPDGGSVTSLKIENITVQKNVFYIGGAADAATRMWRCIRNEIATWPAGGTGYLTDPAVLIGIVLKNLSSGAFSASGRTAFGVDISENKILQELPGGGTAPSIGSVALLDNDSDYYWGWMIVLSSGVPEATNGPDPNTFLDADYQMTTNDFLIYCPVVARNWIYTAAYIGHAGDTGVSAGGTGVLDTGRPTHVFVDGVYGMQFADNRTTSPAATGGFTSVCVFGYNNKHNWYTGNHASGGGTGTPFVRENAGSGARNHYAGNNAVTGNVVTSASTAVFDVTYDGGAGNGDSHLMT